MVEIGCITYILGLLEKDFSFLNIRKVLDQSHKTDFAEKIWAISRDNLILLHANNKSGNQPVHSPRKVVMCSHWSYHFFLT